MRFCGRGCGCAVPGRRPAVVCAGGAAPKADEGGEDGEDGEDGERGGAASARTAISRRRRAR
ncbi:hypothetical protein WK52_13185 [Burkholderia multivorans]|nr:hypothetical protein WK52_13185 [Burkholderia multivorans]